MSESGIDVGTLLEAVTDECDCQRAYVGHIYEWVSDMNDRIMVSFYLVGVATSTGCPQAETVFFGSSSERPKPVSGGRQTADGGTRVLFI